MNKRRTSRAGGVLWLIALAGSGVALVFAAVRLTAQPALAQSGVDGERIYQERCAFCHGDQGEGDGPVARYLNPRPRNFTLGQFRFRITASGELPLLQDVIETVREGVRGTAMPRWEGILTEAEIEAVVDYLTTSFVPFWGTYDPPVIDIPNPPRATSGMIEQGEQLYQELQCWKCHGDQGRGDGPSAQTLSDETDRPIRPADLTKAWRYKGGSSLVDIYTRFSTGMDGTPMPSFYDVISDEQRWALAAFVQSLQTGEPTEESVVTATFLSDELPAGPDDSKWEQADPTSHYLTGQVIAGPRWQTPGVDAVTVRALYNTTDLALLIEWNDPFEDAQTAGSGTAVEAGTYIDLEAFPAGGGPFADRLGVQFPRQIPDGIEKPYFAWGQPGKPVNLWIWQADGQVQEFNATGLKEAPAPQATTNVGANSDWANGHYRLVLTRPLATGDPEDIEFRPGEFIPIAFQAWEGSKGEAGTRFSLSSWNSLVLEQPTPLSAYLYAGLAVAVVAAAEWWLYRRVRS